MGGGLNRGKIGRGLWRTENSWYPLQNRSKTYGFILLACDHLIRNNVDVVYANCVRTALTVGLATRLAGVPMLLYIKGELDNSLLDRIALLLANRVLFFCEANRDDHYPRFIRAIRNKISILPP
mgnify:CR=1 FL=1